MSIDREATEHIARLARIDLQSEEIDYYAFQLSKIVSYIAKIDELDLKSVPASFSPHTETNVYRDDRVCEFDNRDGLIKIFPASQEDFIKIPKVIE
ncbi:Asp-tRNA(Asn)/Glu-tRNA(Gln) amidotransferase subunit GatC [Candidatus Omnitrophota bacterium]